MVASWLKSRPPKINTTTTTTTTTSPTFEGEVEAAQAVAGQRVCAALQDHRARVVKRHDAVNDGLEDELVALVVHAVLQRHVDGVVAPFPVANVL